jgi:hypothetical protein
MQREQNLPAGIARKIARDLAEGNGMPAVHRLWPGSEASSTDGCPSAATASSRNTNRASKADRDVQKPGVAAASLEMSWLCIDAQTWQMQKQQIVFRKH